LVKRRRPHRRLCSAAHPSADAHSLLTVPGFGCGLSARASATPAGQLVNPASIIAVGIATCDVLRSGHPVEQPELREMNNIQRGQNKQRCRPDEPDVLDDGTGVGS
jgi:hypothetical protein